MNCYAITFVNERHFLNSLFFQASIIVALTAVFVPKIIGHNWQFTDEEEKETFCPFSDVLFTGIILVVTWALVGIAATTMFFLRVKECRMNRAEERELDEESASFASAEEF